MAKKGNNLFGAPPKALASQNTRVPVESKPSVAHASDLKAMSIGSTLKITSRNFGAFHSKAAASSSSSSQQGSSWTSLLSQATSGNGLASVFTSPLSGLTGIGGLISGLVGLFGSGSAPPTPVQFTLPKSQENTVLVQEQRATPMPVTTTTMVTSGQSSGGNGEVTAPSFQQRSAPVEHSQVVQAVRQALLNSSSLNDVIAEI